jgi:hypothetical protein
MTNASKTLMHHVSWSEYLKNRTPGPGQYELDSAYKSIKPGNPSFSLLSKAKPSKESKCTPAPNEYDTTQFRNKEVHCTSLKFRKSHNGKNVDSGPGPLDYADAYLQRSTSEGKTFGSRCRRCRHESQE